MAVKPQSFTAFCASLGVTLEPGQRVLCQCAFDGIDPVDLPPGDRAAARRIFGDVERVPEPARAVLAAVCGARSGKSYLLSAARGLHLALTVDVSRLARGEEAVAAFVAPALKTARIPFRFVEGFIDSSPSIARMVTRRTDELIVLDRGNGKSVALWCLPATAGGLALRGRWFVFASLEEAAFFRDRDFKVNDSELFEAVAPRLLRGAQVVVPSTPWARTGLLYEFWRDNRGAPKSALVAHAATEVLRSDADVLAGSAREKARDLEKWRREYGAEFLDVGTSHYFNGAMVQASEGPPAAWPAPPGALVTAGGDAGLTSDSSALVILYRLGDDYHVLEELEHRPEEGKPLVPSVTFGAWAERVAHYGALGVSTDPHYRESIREEIIKRRLVLYDAPGGSTGKAETYAKARAIVNEGRVHGLSSRLGAQLREVVYRATSGGGLSITSPRGPGGHGDIASALVLALHQAWGAVVPKPRPPPDSEAAMLAEERARLDDEVRRRRNDRAENEAFYDDS